MFILLEETEKVIEAVETDMTRKMDKRFPDSTDRDSKRISIREKHKRLEQPGN